MQATSSLRTIRGVVKVLALAPVAIPAAMQPGL